MPSFLVGLFSPSCFTFHFSFLSWNSKGEYIPLFLICHLKGLAYTETWRDCNLYFSELAKKCFTVSLWNDEKENLLLSLFPFSSSQYVFPHFYILFLWYPLCPTSGTCREFILFLLHFWFCILIFSFASAILWNNCHNKVSIWAISFRGVLLLLLLTRKLTPSLEK